ncbi:MAG: hypothetical protein WA886_09170, partial [Candidatus Acidiferrales bacterium]
MDSTRCSPVSVDRTRVQLSHVFGNLLIPPHGVRRIESWRDTFKFHGRAADLWWLLRKAGAKPHKVA